jgi:hypothetical protein
MNLKNFKTRKVKRFRNGEINVKKDVNTHQHELRLLIRRSSFPAIDPVY